jgi:acetyl-CoA C-acetyltransferase
MPVRDVVILSAARTPIGRYGGSFKDLHPADLGAVAARAAIERAGISASDAGEVLIGHGRQAGSAPNPGRQDGHRAGIPHRAPAQTINKACASGLQAIVSGAQSILLGESEPSWRAASSSSCCTSSSAATRAAAWRRCASAVVWGWHWQ